MGEKFARWPMLGASALFTTAAIGFDRSNPQTNYIVVVLFILAAITLGAFIYAEGARHREWLESLFGKEGEDHPDGPGVLPEGEE